MEATLAQRSMHHTELESRAHGVRIMIAGRRVFGLGFRLTLSASGDAEGAVIAESMCGREVAAKVLGASCAPRPFKPLKESQP
jgi:hypothetical protein